MTASRHATVQQSQGDADSCGGCARRGVASPSLRHSDTLLLHILHADNNNMTHQHNRMHVLFDLWTAALPTIRIAGACVCRDLIRAEIFLFCGEITVMQ
jgi:hypothetical protein